MEIYLEKSNGGIRAADEFEREKLKKLRNGHYKVEIKQARNYKFHKKYFALLNYVLENQDKYTSLEPLRREIIMKTGRYEAHHHVHGGVSYYPQSISFAKMSEEEFKDLVSDSINVILRDFCTQIRDDQLWHIAGFI